MMNIRWMGCSHGTAMLFKIKTLQCHADIPPFVGYLPLSANQPQYHCCLKYINKTKKKYLNAPNRAHDLWIYHCFHWTSKWISNGKKELIGIDVFLIIFKWMFKCATLKVNVFIIISKDVCWWTHIRKTKGPKQTIYVRTTENLYFCVCHFILFVIYKYPQRHSVFAQNNGNNNTVAFRYESFIITAGFAYYSNLVAMIT